MERRVTPEMMEAADVDRRELSRALGWIRWVNRRLGGSRALIRWLDRWSKDWPAGEPMTLLDVATGSADVPIAARAWAARRGIDLRITAFDRHPRVLELACEHLAGCDPSLADGVTLEEGDALDMVDRYGVGSFHFVHAGLFIHHLREINALNVLRQMDRVSLIGLVWNDLVRSRAGLAAVHLATVGMHEMSRHDARVSVRAGFTRAEALDMAGRVGLVRPRYDRYRLVQRFTVTSHKVEG